MKLDATKLAVALGLTLVAVLNAPRQTSQANSCQCPEPPGGSVSCPKGLVPVCIIKDGKVISVCAEIASRGEPFDDEARAAALLSGFLRRRVPVDELQSDALLESIRREGGLRTPEVSLTFRLTGHDDAPRRLADLPQVTEGTAARAVSDFAWARESGFAIVPFEEEEEDLFVTWRPAPHPGSTPTPAATPSPAP